MTKYILTSSGELYHYGVKGMKWGVRRDARLLTKSRRNRKVREAQNEYKSGKIDKEARDRKIEKARQMQKSEMASIKNKFASAKTDSERSRLERDLFGKMLNEVPYAGIKRGASTVNAILGAANSASIGLTAYGMTAINPAFAGAAITAGVVGVAAETGYRYALQLGLDKLS